MERTSIQYVLSLTMKLTVIDPVLQIPFVYFIGLNRKALNMIGKCTSENFIAAFVTAQDLFSAQRANPPEQQVTQNASEKAPVEERLKA
jgi:hypothetical protein